MITGFENIKKQVLIAHKQASIHTQLAKEKLPSPELAIKMLCETLADTCAHKAVEQLHSSMIKSENMILKFG